MLTQNGLFHFGLPASGLANQLPWPGLYSAAWPYTSRDRNASAGDRVCHQDSAQPVEPGQTLRAAGWLRRVVRRM
jgi:hypothetical protein